MSTTTTPTTINDLAVELRLRIAECLDEPSLARLSRVSKEWTAPANDVLWSYLESLSPLLRFLPRKLVAGEWVPETPIRVATLAKFDEFASRVRVVDWSEAGWADDTEWLTIFAELSQTLLATRPAHPLLPNVRSFRAYCQTSHGVEAIVPWLSSSTSLTDVEIVLGLAVDDNASMNVLSAVESHHTAQLTSFSLKMDHSRFIRRQHTARALLPLLLGLNAVRKVAVPFYLSLDQHLNALGALPHLEELTLFVVRPPDGGNLFVNSTLLLPPSNPTLSAIDNIPDFPGVTMSSSATPTSTLDPITEAFPRLRSVAITGFLSDIADVVKSTTCNVERLVLAVPCIQDAQEMTRAMQDIALFCPHLVFVAIDIDTVSRDHQEEWVDWNPLARGQGHRSLVISIRHPDLAAYPDAFVIDQQSQTR